MKNKLKNDIEKGLFDEFAETKKYFENLLKKILNKEQLTQKELYMLKEYGYEL